MAKTDDYHQRAEAFLKLWQQQMLKQMTDPDAIRAMLTAMQSFGAPSYDANTRRPAPAPDAGDDAIRRLTKRVDTLERELSAVHARLDAAKNTPRTSNRAHAKPVAKRKPTVGGSGRATKQKSKPVAAKPKRKR